ncbi:hypothetical protein NC653_019726 [Populus alba x Populus x berolinensis]|uniref:Uncharacterized protein n=1 Tax=Populus alba x Populus x berolinensis TaxID=444605 RepID=A0AAD6QJQ0_9ROSI|nr:hypothetical protein NC653_019726 [Populus alba x Populus x berolinensis]
MLKVYGVLSLLLLPPPPPQPPPSETKAFLSASQLGYWGRRFLVLNFKALDQFFRSRRTDKLFIVHTHRQSWLKEF